MKHTIAIQVPVILKDTRNEEYELISDKPLALHHFTGFVEIKEGALVLIHCTPITGDSEAGREECSQMSDNHHIHFKES